MAVALDISKCSIGFILCEMTVIISRVAVVVLGYKDLCLGSVHPIGLCSLYRRLLESKGYKVVTVPSIDFPVQSTLQSKLKYLEQRLKEACDYKHGDL